MVSVTIKSHRLIVVMPNVVMLSVVMLSVVILNVVMLNVVAPDSGQQVYSCFVYFT